MELTNKKSIVVFAINLLVAKTISAQVNTDGSSPNKWTYHFQLTTIAQKHSGFKSVYSGNNSLADTVDSLTYCHT